MASLAGPALNLAASYEAALQVMQERAVSFYAAFSMLPEDRFRAVAAVYAFCRAADDIADQSQPGDRDSALQQIARLEALLWGLYKGKGSAAGKAGNQDLHYPWLPAFEDALRRFSLPIAPFLNQLAGQRMDIHFAGIPNTEGLIRYGRLVAGSVGLMLLPMLARDRETARRPDLMAACEDLGIGMQITNILRDVGEDLRLRGRIYLPRDLMREHQLTREELLALAYHAGQDPPPVPQGFVRLFEGLSSLADGFYQGIAPCLCLIHPACRTPLLAAARSYQAIAGAVRDTGYNCFTRRCYTRKEQRGDLYHAAQVQVQQLSC